MLNTLISISRTLLFEALMMGRPTKEGKMWAGKFDPAYIKVDKKALDETERLHQLFICDKEKEDANYNNYFTISYLNVARLRPKYEDILSDHLLMKSDFISFGETWLHNDETVSFEAQGFDGIHANVCDGQGLATFSKILYKERTTLYTDKTFSATFVKNDARFKRPRIGL